MGKQVRRLLSKPANDHFQSLKARELRRERNFCITQKLSTHFWNRAPHNEQITYAQRVKLTSPEPLQVRNPCSIHPEYQQATLTTVVFLGMLLSSSIWGILADKYGRRTILVVSIRDRIASLKSQNHS